MIRALALAVLALAASLPSVAEAQRVGLEPFSGPLDNVVRRVVRGELEDRGLTVVDVDEGDAGDVDAVVQGRLRGSRRRAVLRLTLTGRDGEELARQRTRVRPNARGQRAVQRAVGSLLDEAGDFASAPEPEPEPEPEPAPTAVAEPDDDEGDSPSSSAGGDVPYLHLLVGLSLRNRSLTATTTADGTRLGNDVPLFPELLAEARVRPLAVTGDPLLAGLRARLRFGYALFFESSTPSGQVVGGSAWSLEGDLGWLFPLVDIVELGATVGGGFTSYGIDDNALVPTIEYGSFEARAVTRIQAIGRELVIRAEAGYRYAAASGPFTEANGAADGHGVVVEGGLEGMFPFDANVGLSWLAAVEWQSVWLTFAGEPPTLSDAQEQLIRGRFAIGLALR